MIKVKFLGINGSLQECGNGNTSFIIFGEQGSSVIDLSCNLDVVVSANIDAVILTHEHIDHVYALPSLLHQLWISGRKKDLHIYISKEMYSLVDDFINLFHLREKKNIFKIKLCTEKNFQVGSICFTTYKTNHTDRSIGIVAEEKESKIVYTGDTRPINKIKACMMGAHMLIHDASGLNREETLDKSGHSSGFAAGEMARKLNVKKLFLCHLPQGEISKQEILKEAKTVFEQSYIPNVLEEKF